ncbi:ATP-binding protein [Neobacillus sp. PS3-34]|uniref:AlbA family DNA-binding domain-containing protein n=1 Tax=Neobacillus sp. PS3-34 TaxID=3070678 RepID=UPI0027E0C078|nr:ATP-binding protein [Neobacillus sp. PS3-34]WML50243.1 ATP-binding protein [Neobacillus sp. PS3-34]
MEKIEELIKHGYECDYLDFKEKQYSKDKHMDLIADIMAMANSRHEGDKFIITGVKDRPEGKEIKGITLEEFVDSSNYIQVILSNIEPDIQFDYFKYEYEGTLLGVFRIYNTNNKPYMLKRKYNKLNEGLCLIRKGSSNSVAKRSDFDFMYQNNGLIEVKFLEQTLYAVHDLDGCASIDVLLANTTENPITITAGYMNIHNKDGKKLSHHPVFGIDRVVGADFKIGIQPKSEIVGKLFVGFSSSDPLRLDIDEYGVGNYNCRFELLLFDARGNQYSTTIEQGNVLVNGDFLWKVKKQKGIPHKFRTHKMKF